MKTLAVSTAIRTLYHTGAHRLFSPHYAGVGSILMFHRISSRPGGSFAPNYGLGVTAKFFEAVIQRILNRGIDIVDLAEVRRRLSEKDFRKKFICLTFDDGYLDNFEEAFPVCRRLGTPMTIYVTTGFIDRTARCWWLGLDHAVSKSKNLLVRWHGRELRLRCGTTTEKQVAFATCSDLFNAANPQEREALCAEMERASGVDFLAETDMNFMTWDQVRELAESGLVTIAGHTTTHSQLARMSRHTVESEIAGGCVTLESRIGKPVTHFAYPFGRESDAGEREFAICRSLGLLTAVTTRPGTLMPEHAATPYALPRLGVSGWHQNLATIDVMLSGATAALSNGFRRVV